MLKADKPKRSRPNCSHPQDLAQECFHQQHCACYNLAVDLNAEKLRNPAHLAEKLRPLVGLMDMRVFRIGERGIPRASKLGCRVGE
jgi:hypothetical protein